jgi:GT2 family glycosyltransferase/2-polyprenyl-3-methyl-5-hydroxy-6-metoxy-1,4-benzoquinol methylase
VTPDDLTVVIPTRQRWDIVTRTLDALDHQTVTGFEVIVVVDGTDDAAPDAVTRRANVRVLTQTHAGPGVARNTGVAATSRELVLLLGDDMVPDPALVAAHLDAHNEYDDARVAILGHVDWHPDAEVNHIQRWLDWSGTQFDFHLIDPTKDAGFGRFFSCNVSLRRSLYDAAGGFDPDFTYYYEDLDFGWRLHQQRMRLQYRPTARARHLHRYDWAALQRRFDGIVIGERMMAAKHPWFEPWYRDRMKAALAEPPRSRMWPRLADLIPDAVVERVPGTRRVRRYARRRANTRMYQNLAPRYLWLWSGYEGLDELRTYLGADFDEARLHLHAHHVDVEEASAEDQVEFYRTTDAYLYDLTAFAMWDTKLPYFEAIKAAVAPGARLLDYGCGIGTDGLRLVDAGFRVGFAEFDNPSSKYLRWRLDRRGLGAPRAEVYDVDGHVPGGFDLAYSIDVIEHVEDPWAFLAGLEARAPIVAVNFLEDADDHNHRHPHHSLPITELLAHCEERGIITQRTYHGGRSHFVIYRSGGGASSSPIGDR